MRGSERPGGGRGGPDWVAGLPVAAGLLGAGVVLWATSRYGIGLSPDSVSYLAAGKSIAAGDGVTSWDGAPLIVQPPLYPLLLALFLHLPGISPLHGAAWLNALLFASTLFLAGRLAMRYWNFHPLWTALLLGTMVAARPLFLTGVQALSEALFHFWVLLFLAAALSWSRMPDRRSLLLLALSAAGAVMTRYIGVTVIATGGLLLLLVHRRRTLPARATDLALYTILSSTPFVLWLWRNHALSGTFMGPRDGSGYTLGQNLLFTAVTILCWYVPLKELRVFAWLKQLYLGASGSMAAALPVARPRQAVDGLLASPSAVPGLFILVYVGLLVYSSTTTGYDQISDRLLAPVHIPLTILLFSRLQAWSFRFPRMGRVLAALVFLCCVAVPGWKTMSSAAAFARDGVGAGDDSFGQYNSRAWRESETLAYLREHARDGRALYSNSAPAVAQWTGLPARPLLGAPRSAPEWLEDEEALVVWFRKEFREDRDPEAFLEGAEWERVGVFEDGVVYRVRR